MTHRVVLDFVLLLLPCPTPCERTCFELEHGRVRKAERWGPRTLDLDILLYGDQLIRTERLQIPHYHMHARAFVLYPLAEIAPALKMPDGTALETLLQNCPRGDLQALPFFIQQPGAQTDLTPPG